MRSRATDGEWLVLAPHVHRRLVTSYLTDLLAAQIGAEAVDPDPFGWPLPAYLRRPPPPGAMALATSGQALAAAWLAEGWTPGCPSAATMDADLCAVGALSCTACGAAGRMAYKPFMRPGPGGQERYRVLVECLVCGHGEEF